MKLFKAVSDIFKIAIVIPLIIIGVIVLIPFGIIFYLRYLISKIKDKKNLKRLCHENDNQIFFMYARYNNVDFSSLLKDKFEELTFVEVKNHYENDILINHMIEDCNGQNFPRLVKIKNGQLFHKIHFGTFKHFYKRKNDAKSFIDIIERSVKNLENENKNIK
ncbi:hypothetical protein [Hyunsoonleella ulvae]|uniref:hypothetical protein n=1 Tax=Hyunsoonleella ulvae TaxID=2799948 RepID=UPI00193A95C9|nr:hypothetical protein [Hyunsoonleella ulvae]